MILLSSNNLEGNPLAFNVYYVVYLKKSFYVHANYFAYALINIQ